MCIGAVVRSKAGRDRYRLYRIVGITEDGRVQIANGVLHTLANPKVKNLRHLEVLSPGGSLPPTDALLAADLQDFESTHKNHDSSKSSQAEANKERF